MKQKLFGNYKTVNPLNLLNYFKGKMQTFQTIEHM